jgi:hypothetical protein
MVVDSWEFVPDAGAMVVMVTWCTSTLVAEISATGRLVWVAVEVIVATAPGVKREGTKVIVVKKVLSDVDT